MATEQQIRERRKGSSKTVQATKNHEEHSRASNTWSRSLLLFYLLIGASVVFFIITYPDVAKQIIEPWYEFEESKSPVEDLRVGIIADIPKRDAVVAAFKHAWRAYEKDAWGDDEYHPIKHRGSNLSEAGGVGYTIVDAIDTIVIMGLDEEERKAREWVATKLDFNRDGSFNTFETTIRVLGGLLSAHFLTKEPVYLERAVDLADRMIPVFDTPSGVPLSMVNLAKGKGIPDKDNNGLSSTAEATTLQLEFKYLSYLTDNDTYWRAVERVMSVVKNTRMKPALAPIFISPDMGQFVSSAIRLGSRGDSFYEYLLKQYLQTDRTETVYREMYDDTMDAIHEHLLKRSMTENLLYTSELVPERNTQSETTWRLIPKQDHLVCFLGGSAMLGATDGAHAGVPPNPKELSSKQSRDWKTGIELIKTCMATHDTRTGLSPEIAHFRLPSDPPSIAALARTDWYIKGVQGIVSYDARYILRPETVESLFIAYRLTGDQKYRDWGWKIFSSIEKYCKLPEGGYASILNVDSIPVEHDDKMETFFLSETLKYLYLLFSESSVLPLDTVVFNTEAHPLPVFQPRLRTGFS